MPPPEASCFWVCALSVHDSVVMSVCAEVELSQTAAILTINIHWLTTFDYNFWSLWFGPAPEKIKDDIVSMKKISTNFWVSWLSGGASHAFYVFLGLSFASFIVTGCVVCSCPVCRLHALRGHVLRLWWRHQRLGKFRHVITTIRRAVHYLSQLIIGNKI